MIYGLKYNKKIDTTASPRPNMSIPPPICTLTFISLLPSASGSVGPAAFAKGRGGRRAPFAGAHFVPSHRFLRPRSAGTCLRRAPPSSRGRGGPRPRPPSPSPTFSRRALRKPPAVVLLFCPHSSSFLCPLQLDLWVVRENASLRLVIRPTRACA